MLVKFTSDVILGSGVGLVIGAFLPSIGRKIKALFVKETTKVKADLKAEVTKVEKKL